uniref:VQ domain-containing protein n=1 Tax=Opuntia streptacantha TaxID=393608 RepID=A0A7C9AC91_OPUST
MDNHKSSHSCSSGDSPASAVSISTAVTAAAATGGDKDQFLRHLNKLSHKISKPSSSSIGRPPPDSSIHLRPPPAPGGPPLQQQPPVYNINKSEFRDVVQKLTGSPAHAPPPIHAPKPASSRLQRIRPPPLVELSNRPPAVLNCAVPPPNPSSGGAGGVIRQIAPLSPLPPLPTCHAAAESPISAYMRFLRNSISAVDSFNNRNPLQMIPPPESFASPPPPSSPLPFGCLPSPTGAGPLGFPQLPLSPTVPGVPSPK